MEYTNGSASTPRLIVGFGVLFWVRIEFRGFVSMWSLLRVQCSTTELSRYPIICRRASFHVSQGSNKYSSFDILEFESILYNYVTIRLIWTATRIWAFLRKPKGTWGRLGAHFNIHFSEQEIHWGAAKLSPTGGRVWLYKLTIVTRYPATPIRAILPLFSSFTTKQ